MPVTAPPELLAGHQQLALQPIEPHRFQPREPPNVLPPLLPVLPPPPSVISANLLHTHVLDQLFLRTYRAHGRRDAPSTSPTDHPNLLIQPPLNQRLDSPQMVHCNTPPPAQHERRPTHIVTHSPQRRQHALLLTLRPSNRRDLPHSLSRPVEELRGGVCCRCHGYVERGAAVGGDVPGVGQEDINGGEVVALAVVGEGLEEGGEGGGVERGGQGGDCGLEGGEGGGSGVVTGSGEVGEGEGAGDWSGLAAGAAAGVAFVAERGVRLGLRAKRE